MSFEEKVGIDKNRLRLDGTIGKTCKVTATFTADGSGNGGSITIPNVNGALCSVGTSAAMVVEVADIDNVDLMGPMSGVSLDSRYNLSIPAEVIGGVIITVTGAPANTTNKVFLYVK